MCAAADGQMVDDATERFEPANTGARIHASVIDTSLMARTVGNDSAFGPARDVRISAVIRRTNTSGRSAVRINKTMGIRATRVRLARTRLLRSDHFG